MKSSNGAVAILDLFGDAPPLRWYHLGLIRRKPNHAGFFIHTDKTREALRDR